MFMLPKREHSFQDLLKEVFSSRSIISFFLRYSFTLLVTFIIILLKWEIRPLNEGSPYVILLVPVVLSAYIGGFMCGVVATAIAAVNANYLFVSPQPGFTATSTNIVQSVAFVLEGLMASGLIEMIARGREREYRLRQWYEVTLSSIGDAVIATDNEGYVMYMNPVAEDLTGWRFARAYGRSLVQVFNTVEEATGKRASDPVQQAIIRDGTITSNHIVLLSKKGTEILVDESVSPIKNMAGDTIGVIIAFRDVTGMRRSQEALRLSEERLRLALNHTNIMAWGQDRRFRYTWVHNISFPGFGPDDIIGKTDRQMKTVSRLNLEKLEQLKREIVKTKKTQTVELNIGTEKKPRFLEVTIQPEIDWRGNVKGIYGISVDITKRKMMEEKKDEFLSIASHELRTPLTSIKGYVQILERVIRDTGNGKARVYLNRTKVYVDKLGGLISDLLDVTKIQSGKLQLNMETFDLGELIDQAVESAQLITDTHRIVKKGSVHLRLTGDKNRLEQVLANLLSNAIKYSPHADQVIVSSKQEDRRVVVSVQDFGIGIPAASRPRLFSRFYRVEQSARQFTGLGIGLYISQEIVTRHGGDMRVESEEGKGSVFSFSLPLHAKAIPT